MMAHDLGGDRHRGPVRLDPTYRWPRFWVPPDGTIDLSDAGFLRDPTEWLARPLGPEPLAALQHWRALVLLGEPGIGKSTTLKEEADRVASLPANANLSSIHIDLRAFSSESLLCQKVFESFVEERQLAFVPSSRQP